MTGRTDESGSEGASVSRRRFLGATATGALAGASYPMASGRGRAQSARTIELGGEIAGWQGRAPEGIAGETNPTLRLEAGQDYRITWTNLDGFGHNVALLDDNGEVIERTQVMSEQGATQTIELTAREEMAEYVCEPHSTSMRGAISFGSGTETATATETPQRDAVPQGPAVGLERIAGGFEVPTDFAVPPGDGRRFILDLPGQMYVHDADGLREEPFLDVSDRLSEISGERGLLGVAFHPDFAANRRFFLRYSAPLAEDAPDEFSHTEVLAEFTASEDGEMGVPESERILLEVNEPREVHNGGAVTFGPDGYLYVSLGDGGSPRDTGTGHVADWYERNGGGNGQDVSENLLGSVLRLDVDSRTDGKPYGIPDDNPLVGQSGLPEQFAWGFRNPWRMGFSDGELFVADVGQNRYEEVNRVVKGGNYGWNVKEGTHCYGTESATDFPESCPDSTPADVRGGEPLRNPVIEYPHTRDGQLIGISVIGGYIYENDTIPALQGTYVFGDYSKDGSPRGSLFAATPAEDGLWEFTELDIAGAESGAVEGYLIAIGRDETGELYALTSAGELGGAVHRITATESTTRTSAPTAGTQTGTTDTTVTTGLTTTTESTSTATTAANTTEVTEASGARSETGAATTMATDTPQSNGATGSGMTETTAADGPGFGVLAALAGVAGIAARRLARR